MALTTTTSAEVQIGQSCTSTAPLYHYLLTVLFHIPTESPGSQLVSFLSASQPKFCTHLSHRHMSGRLILHDVWSQEYVSSTNYNAPHYTITRVALPLLRHHNEVYSGNVLSTEVHFYTPRCFVVLK